MVGKMFGVVLVGFGLSITAWAGPDADKCSSKGKEAQKKCDETVQAGANAEHAAAAATGAVAAANGPQINPSAPALGNTIAAGDQNLSNLINACNQAKTFCEKQCDSALQSAQAKALKKDPVAQADAKNIPNLKKSDCSDPLDKKLADLGANKDPLAQNKDDANKTGKDSGGMPQIPPISPPSGGDDKKEDTPTPTPASTCQVGDTSAACGGTPAITAAPTGQAGFVLPTNSKSGTPSTGLQTASVDPNGATAVRSGASTGGGSASSSGGGSGGGGMGGGAGAILPSSVGGASERGSAREGLSAGPGSLSTDGGGGGGGYGGGSEPAEFTINPNAFGPKEKPVLPAAPVAGSPHTDRSIPHGPSLFYISDSVISNYCATKGLKKACAK